MRGLFRYDGALNRVLNKIVDVVWLSLLWLISCLPLITIGAATTALYYTVYKVIWHDRGGIWSEYWKAFGTNFKQATPIWLLQMLIIYLFGVSGYSAYLLCSSGQSSKWLFVAVVIPAVLVMMWAVYLFPSIARFNNKTKLVMKNCILIAVLNFGWSLLLVVILLMAVLMTLIIPPAILGIPVLYMFFSGLILERVFRKYMLPDELKMEQELNRRTDE